MSSSAGAAASAAPRSARAAGRATRSSSRFESRTESALLGVLVASRTDGRIGACVPDQHALRLAMSAAEVDGFIAGLDHPRKPEVEAVRQLILGANPGITEQIKWKAPSFCFGGDDRITMNLRKADELELIFHRGAKVKDATNFEFEDPTGLMEWKTKDRAIVRVGSPDDVALHRDDLASLADRWVRATVD